MIKNVKENKQMKYLPKDLKKSYDYDLKNCPDITNISPPLINISDVLQAHYILADFFTDTSAGENIERMLVGIRSYDLLNSAICRQTVSYGGVKKYKDPIEICSTLFFGLVKDHAFNDGNKRTALLTLLNQLQLYGYFPKNKIKDFEKLVVSVAEGSLETKYSLIWKKNKKYADQEIKTIASVLRKLVERKNTAFHLDLTMRSFIQAIEKHGVKYELNGNKIKFERKYPQHIFSKTITYTINFYGWTRAVEAKMVRDTLHALQLSDEYSSIKKFMDGEESMYKLIAQFEKPLRRLKDK